MQTTMKKTIAVALGMLAIGALAFSLRGNQPNKYEDTPYVTPSDWVEPPSMINPEFDRYTEVNVDGSIIINLDNAETWSAEIADPTLLRFIPGSDQGTYETFPGLTGLAKGKTTVKVSNDSGVSYQFTVLIKAKGELLWGPDALAEEIARAVIGKTEAEAVSLITGKGVGLIYRVVKRDGESFVVTTDYRTDRINLEIEKDIVVEANVG